MMLNQYKKSSALQPPGGDKTQQVNENKMHKCFELVRQQLQMSCVRILRKDVTLHSNFIVKYLLSVLF